MSLTIETQADLLARAATLANAEINAERFIRDRHNQLANDLLRLEKDIVHVRTGRLQAGLQIDGPINIARGEFVSTLAAPSVPYADEEAARGAAHDFSHRTIYEGRNLIAAAQNDMSNAIVTAIEGK